MQRDAQTHLSACACPCQYHQEELAFSAEASLWFWQTFSPQKPWVYDLGEVWNGYPRQVRTSDVAPTASALRPQYCPPELGLRPCLSCSVLVCRPFSPSLLERTRPHLPITCLILLDCVQLILCLSLIYRLAIFIFYLYHLMHFPF